MITDELHHNFSDKRIREHPIGTGVRFTARAGTLYTNVPHLVVSHSPDGFNVGYAGSGPADLALNICEWYCREVLRLEPTEDCHEGKCTELAWKLHQKFKFDFLTKVTIPSLIKIETVQAWFLAHLPPDFKTAEILEKLV